MIITNIQTVVNRMKIYNLVRVHSSYHFLSSHHLWDWSSVTAASYLVRLCFPVPPTPTSSAFPRGWRTIRAILRTKNKPQLIIMEGWKSVKYTFVLIRSSVLPWDVFYCIHKEHKLHFFGGVHVVVIKILRKKTNFDYESIAGTY